MPTENRNHPEDHAAIERLHQNYVGKIERFSDELMTFEDAAYAMGLDRGKKLASKPGVTLQAARANRVYVAGPMTGIADFNYPAFNAVADQLRAQGYEVENPADHGIVEGAHWADYMAYDLTRLGLCGVIALLPDCEKSEGARLEVLIAERPGMTVVNAHDLSSPKIPEAPLLHLSHRECGLEYLAAQQIDQSDYKSHRES
ncbi:DUF4406 domain-containing protein [Pseudomonas extremorientalis]|uniref:DUF4406 domain-containing protein n=1 Tax=Pseudomonas extremorientalis TaxID=169669 RepID=UPI002733350B|nr:DUF4406 domain-containing protein [Pseudomonas extremorientalis]WLG54051.1 DUF4406 domain-containing protein [Pseudomonas extremorientalis]